MGRGAQDTKKRVRRLCPNPWCRIIRHRESDRSQPGSNSTNLWDTTGISGTLRDLALNSIMSNFSIYSKAGLIFDSRR